MAAPLQASSLRNPIDQTEIVLSALYSRAHQIDMEFTASSYWQARLQVAFPIRDGFACLCEQSPDDSDRTRLDQIIYRVNSQSFILTQIVIVESKRQDQGLAHLRKAESQMLDGCTRAWEYGSLPRIYGLTTWRTKFRAWSFNSHSRKLIAMDGGPDLFADKKSYLDITEAENIFNMLVSLAKGTDLELPQGFQGQQDLQTSPASQPLSGASQPDPLPSQQGCANEPQYDESTEVDVGEASSSMHASEREDSWLEVRVTVDLHRTRKDEWCFRDVKGSLKIIPRDRWRQVKMDGRDAWVWSKGRRNYYTFQNI